MSLFDPRVLGAAPTGRRRERVQASPRYRNGKFHNTVPVTGWFKEGQPISKQASLVKELVTQAAQRRPAGELPMERPLLSWARDAETGLRVTWLGHSTMLLEIDGIRVLTDPVWGERVSPMSWAGPRRFHRVPVTIAELPPLDAVLVSHDHYDHLDYPTILELARRDVPFYTSLGVGAHLEAWGIQPSRIVELDWWETAELPARGLNFTAAPSRHFSGRGTGRDRTLWSSWVLATERRKVFFSGDTGPTEELAEIGRRLGPFELSAIEIGAHHPSWDEIHLGPDNALIAHEMLGGGTLLPVHWGTFDLALHAWDEPIERVAVGAAKKGIPLVTPRLGMAIEPSRTHQVDDWWRTVDDSLPESSRGERIAAGLDSLTRLPAARPR